MTKLKNIGVRSSSILLGTLMACVGLMAGILYSFGGAIIDILVSMSVISSGETPGLGYGTALAFLALIGMPITFAIPGLIIGAIGAFLYNLVAGWVGGIEMDFEQ